ncbi:LacI family DNA-binding transcriptional regulator [Levilactobacillus tujiorum]|uniref:Substrate-binding domain-containing protein n=1 Tax=Levilactobacillus tujiorum TaxID=2912243 RepID=A0ABX1L7T2_9LACO|nr:substrate-binding domain-containing protein [Levilactobacillus tujiorum]MCH5464109.1 substrate-binding domain-containing protein [Levilactobacillus tujiorum]NLR11208.1 substrate-binding domain-containing protein [Lactobacillus sp. HBUAS51387]NLR29165.1 substrate-binding domain-containing protein [Levilactobacillus tujiorum]
MDKFTIKDIAKLGEVSTATVSNFLNGNYTKMSVATRDKLAGIINKTDYHPSTTARNLAKNENKTIGVSVADITNPFTSPVISGLSERCEAYGYKMIFTNSNNDEQREIENINRLREEEVAGFIIDPVNPDSSIYNQLSNAYTVIVDRQARRSVVDTVVTDNMNSVATMVRKMVAKGYDDLYFVSWPLDGVSTRLNRYAGFKLATKYLNDDHLITVPYNTSLSQGSSFDATLDHILANKGDKRVGFFAMNSRTLLQLLKAAQRLNYQYAEDFGVATYEEFEWMQLMNPGISCVRQDSFAIGCAAMDRLKEKLTTAFDNEPAPEVQLIPTELVYRDSF